MREHYRVDNSSKSDKSGILRIHLIVLAKEVTRFEALSGNQCPKLDPEIMQVTYSLQN